MTSRNEYPNGIDLDDEARAAMERLVESDNPLASVAELLIHLDDISDSSSDAE